MAALLVMGPGIPVAVPVGIPVIIGIAAVISVAVSVPVPLPVGWVLAMVRVFLDVLSVLVLPGLVYLPGILPVPRVRAVVMRLVPCLVPYSLNKPVRCSAGMVPGIYRDAPVLCGGIH